MQCRCPTVGVDERAPHLVSHDAHECERPCELPHDESPVPSSWPPSSRHATGPRRSESRLHDGRARPGRDARLRDAARGEAPC